MAYLNKVELIGNVGKAPRAFEGESGGVSFRLATSRRWKDQDGKIQERTEWHNVVAFDKLAEIIRKYVKKGELLYLEGEIRTRSYTYNDDEGIQRTREVTEIVAREMQMLTPRKDSADEALASDEKPVGAAA